ncbi:unnamed protein product [Calypogeia fissa]
MEAVRQLSCFSSSSLLPRLGASSASLLDRNGGSSSNASVAPSSSTRGDVHFLMRARRAKSTCSSGSSIVIRCASKKTGGGGSSTRGRSQGSTSSSPTGGGFGAKTVSKKPSFDAGVLLRRSEQLYRKLLAEHVSEGEIREFVICVREKKSESNNNKASSVLDDWLPVAELALVSEQDASEALPVLLPILCREVAECAAKGAVALRSISRSGLEYAYEPAEAFYEYVTAGSNVKLSSTECPYAVLGLAKGAPASEVRAAYRSLAGKNHPDKQFGADTDATAAEAEFKRVTSAYDEIKRAGLASEGGATYASLGGNARNGLSEPIVITSDNRSSELPKGVKVAVRQLDSEIVSQFLTRLYARSGGATVL